MASLEIEINSSAQEIKEHLINLDNMIEIHPYLQSVNIISDNDGCTVL
jgi:hypothetical protein